MAPSSTEPRTSSRGPGASGIWGRESRVPPRTGGLGWGDGGECLFDRAENPPLCDLPVGHLEGVGEVLLDADPAPVCDPGLAHVDDHVVVAGVDVLDRLG